MAEERKGTSPLLYIVGLVIAIVIGVIGWFAAPAVIDFLRSNVQGFSTAGIPQIKLIVTAVVFVFGLIIASLVVAVISPKPDRSATLGEMAKERDELVKQKREARRRARRR
jgi:TRAP-type C4-dicarboxylate transport system permease small subunit